MQVFIIYLYMYAYSFSIYEFVTQKANKQTKKNYYWALEKWASGLEK